MNQEYCSRECANADFQKMMEDEAAGIQVFKRKPDCLHYDFCSTLASTSNNRHLDCDDCEAYLKKTEAHIVFQEDHLWKML